RRPDDRLLADGLERGELALALEKPTAGRQLVKEDSQRENVRTSIEGLAEALLRRHVLELALELTGLGLRVSVSRLRDAEVDDLYLPGVRPQHVLRRDIAVDDALASTVVVGKLMGSMQTRAGFRDDVHSQSEVEPHATRQQPTHQSADAFAFDVL